MVSRLPESRALALKATVNENELIFQSSKKCEVFSSSVHKRGTNNRLISVSINDNIPLRTKLIDWKEKTDALCLHCSESCPGIPFPAVKYHDSKEDKYWIYGFFCRPCCALGYIQEHPTTESGRCLLWTQTIFRKYFNISEELFSAPPRHCLQKYGGNMTLEDFYGKCGYKFKQMNSPPFVTFAMYAELTKTDLSFDDTFSNVKNLRRPKERTVPIAVHEETGKPPLILEFLARRGILPSPIQNNVEEIQQKKKKKVVKVEEDTTKINSGLSKYLIN